MSPRMGRPVSDNPRLLRVETKMNVNELSKLDECCRLSGKTRSEIIRSGIDLMHTKLNKLKKK